MLQAVVLKGVVEVMVQMVMVEMTVKVIKPEEESV